MKVALSFPGCHRRGGVERVVLEAANFLYSRGHEVHVYASEWDDVALDKGIRRRQVPAFTGPSPVRLFAFSRSCTRELSHHPPVDVLGAFGVQSPYGGVLWVQSVHKAWLGVSQRTRRFAGRAKQWLNPFHPSALLLERLYYGGRRYRKLIALTGQVKDDLVRLYDVPAGDVEIIPNGFAPGEFNLARCRQVRESARRRLGYSPGDAVVLFAANELERKGFGPLIRALAVLDPCVRLLAVGRLDAATYAREIGELGLADRVTFTGPTNDVARYYAAADVFALPTQYEAWGLVIVEAMACGLPVLTSRLAGAAVAVQEGRSGYLLDNPGSVDEIAMKLQLLLDGHHLSAEPIADSVQQYAWSNVLLAYERVLAECAGTKGRPARLGGCPF